MERGLGLLRYPRCTLCQQIHYVRLSCERCKKQDVSVYDITRNTAEPRETEEIFLNTGCTYEYMGYACLIMRAKIRTCLRVMFCMHFLCRVSYVRGHAYHFVNAALCCKVLLPLPNPQVENHRLSPAHRFNFIYPLSLPHWCNSEHSLGAYHSETPANCAFTSIERLPCLDFQ
jgi:hypothetical protein